MHCCLISAVAPVTSALPAVDLAAQARVPTIPTPPRRDSIDTDMTTQTAPASLPASAPGMGALTRHILGQLLSSSKECWTVGCP